MVLGNEVNRNGSQPRSMQRKLHLVIHGLVAIHMSEAEKSVTVHIPDVEMHEYRAGDFNNLQPLEAGADYQLNNFSPGRLRLDPEKVVDDFISVPLADKGLTVKPHDTHASIKVPWPNDLKCVRKLVDGENPLFNEDVNPRELGYISYLTYLLKDGEKPALKRNGKTFWTSNSNDAHIRLHVFADPAEPLAPAKYKDHMRAAYGAFNDQIFQKPFDLTPNVDTPMRFATVVDNKDIPPNEAVDLWAVPHQRDEDQSGPHIEGSGNCVSVFLFDRLA